MTVNVAERLEERLAATLLATDADTAHRHAGACSICEHAILTGQRYALLVPSGKAVHLPCLAAMAAPRRRVPVIW